MTPRSYKAWFTTAADKTGHGTNQLAFATQLEAEEYANELTRRWLSVTHWEVRPSDDVPNYTFIDGQAVPIA